MKRLALIGFVLLLSQWMRAQTVTFSATGGFYDASFELALQCNAAYQIRYTINGNTPTGASALYEAPLWLDEDLYSKSDIYTIQTACDELFFAPETVQHCITLRAAAFDEAGNCVGPVATQSYFIRSLGCDTHGLPVMAISADSLALFDYETGILVPGVFFDPSNINGTGNFYQNGREWERLVNVEFYEPNDNSGINQQAGLRTHGGTCRRQTQKGLKIYARDEYGKKRFKHKFFESIPNESFKHLVMKPFSYQWFNYGIQDNICNRMAAHLDVESVASRPMVLFINGEYWGIYYLKEKPDAHYLEDHFGNEDTDYNVVSNWYGYLVDGDTTGFIEMMRWVKDCDLTQEEQYARINEMIDVSSFIDYYCLELFIANNDWPANNMRCYQLDDGKWRWIFFDGDDALAKMDFDVLENATSTINLGWPTDARSTLLFRKLLENKEFGDRFLLRFKELLTSQFTYAVTKPYFDDAAALVRGEVPSQCERFGLPLNLGQWEYDILTVDKFLRTRVENMIDRLAEFFATEDNTTIIKVLYPNPVIDNLHVILWSDGFAVSDIELYDLMGRRVYSQKIVLMEGENYLNLSCPYAAGIYVLRFGNKTQKFVIQ